MWLFLPFIILPIIEIAVFIQVGGVIGLWPTIALVLLSAVVGSWLMRQQGARALADLQSSFRSLGDPTQPLAHGALILLAGALMVTPGFVTDAMGLLLLIPAVRRKVIGQLAARMQRTRRGFGFDAARPRRADRVIDADYVVVPPESSAPSASHGAGSRPPSGWARD